MSDLGELYQEVILDHNRNPRNFGELPTYTHCADGHNPLCGDRLHLQVLLNDGRIEDIAFEGVGCAISKASASLMTEKLKGMTREEALAWFERVHGMFTGTGDAVPPADLGKLAALSGVCEYPSRVKCEHWTTTSTLPPPNRDRSCSSSAAK
jgi:nitrogen fixation NifU-like protein